MSGHPISVSEVKAMEPLKGTTILVTRPVEQTAQLKTMLEQQGARVVVFPTIHIVPTPSWDECDKALKNIAAYDGLILTSVNAATYVLNRARLVNDDGFRTFSQKAIYVVGEKTKRAVDGFGLSARTFEEARDGRTMARALAQQGVKGKRLLFPKGNLASDEIPSILREHGAAVDEVVVYETRPPSDEERARMKEMFSREQVDLVIFFSPSSINNFLSIVPKESLERVRIAAIGQTTSAAAQKALLHSDIIANEPTTEGIVSSIVRFYE